MKVNTFLKVGRTLNTDSPQGTASDMGVLDTLQTVAGHAKSFVTSPQVRGVARELMWWPFGPPRFLSR